MEVASIIISLIAILSSICLGLVVLITTKKNNDAQLYATLNPERRKFYDRFVDTYYDLSDCAYIKIKIKEALVLDKDNKKKQHFDEEKKIKYLKEAKFLFDKEVADAILAMVSIMVKINYLIYSFIEHISQVEDKVLDTWLDEKILPLTNWLSYKIYEKAYRERILSYLTYGCLGRHKDSKRLKIAISEYYKKSTINSIDASFDVTIFEKDGAQMLMCEKDNLAVSQVEALLKQIEGFSTQTIKTFYFAEHCFNGNHKDCEDVLKKKDITMILIPDTFEPKIQGIPFQIDTINLLSKD